MTTIRFHVKQLTPPTIPLATMVERMRQTYAQYGIGVEMVTFADLSGMPNAALLTDIDVGPCRSVGSTPEQNQLFGDGVANWSGWIGLGGPGPGMLGAPATVARNPGVCNLYAWGADNALWQRAFYASHWDPWTRHGDGGVLASVPALGSMGPDHEHIFVRGTDGQVWQKWWTAGGGWSTWVPLGGPPNGFVGAPTTISRNSGVCNLYVRGTDNALWQRPYHDGHWDGWSRHYDGGVLSAEPAPGSMNANHEHVFGRGSDGQVWQKWWLGPTRSRDIVVFLVRSTNGESGPLNGCASHPNGLPGLVVTQVASPWTLAHELGHVLGLPHISGESCNAPGYQPVRLMTGCGTSRLTSPPPDLDGGEVGTVSNSPLVV